MYRGNENIENRTTSATAPDKTVLDKTVLDTAEKKEYVPPVLEQMPPEMQVMKSQEDSGEMSEKEYAEHLHKKYKQKDGEAYLVTTVINQDDEEEKTYWYVFRKPSAPSYDRYAKTSSVSATRALKTFVLDNICEEQKDSLENTLGELPAMAISLGEKLLNILGLSKETTVKKL